MLEGQPWGPSVENALKKTVCPFINESITQLFRNDQINFYVFLEETCLIFLSGSDRKDYVILPCLKGKCKGVCVCLCCTFGGGVLKSNCKC